MTAGVGQTISFECVHEIPHLASPRNAWEKDGKGALKLSPFIKGKLLEFSNKLSCFI